MFNLKKKFCIDYNFFCFLNLFFFGVFESIPPSIPASAIHPLIKIIRFQRNPKANTNTMLPRTSPAIALGHMPNLQGSYRLYCLDTHRIITRRQFTELPMPQKVINQIEDIAKKEASSRKRPKSNKNMEKTCDVERMGTSQDVHEYLITDETHGNLLTNQLTTIKT